MWNTNFSPRQPPRAARPPAARGRCRTEQWWSFIVSLVSSKRMTCSSAMYSDTATLTLKYHVWRVTIRLGARSVRKNRSENRPSRGWIGSGFRGTQNSAEPRWNALAISCSGIVRGSPASKFRGERAWIGDIDIAPRKVRDSAGTAHANRSQSSSSE